jgi:hypothetical protein
MIGKFLLIILFIFVILLIITAFINIIIDHIKKANETKRNVTLYVVGDDYKGLEAFSQVTLNLEAIRSTVKSKELSVEEKDKLLNSIDSSLMELQNILFESQSGVIPDPSVLTKLYLQNISMKALELRLLYETLMGRAITENSEDKNNSFNVLKIVPQDKKNENKKN